MSYSDLLELRIALIKLYILFLFRLFGSLYPPPLRLLSTCLGHYFAGIISLLRHSPRSRSGSFIIVPGLKLGVLSMMQAVDFWCGYGWLFGRGFLHSSPRAANFQGLVLYRILYADERGGNRRQ